MKVQLKPHQLENVTFAEKNKYVLIADEMGLGKTIMMLGTWVGNFKKNTLIVVPSALLNQWDELIYKWFGFQPFVFRGQAAKTPIEEIKKQIFD